MKNKILKLIGVAALALATVFIAPTASAQSPIYAPVTIFSSPTIITTGAVSNSTDVIDCRKQQNVYAMFSFKVTEASSISNMCYVFYKSADGVIYDTNNPVIVRIPAQGVLRVNSGTNIAVSGVPYLMLAFCTNQSTGTMTNYGIVYALKTGSP